MPRNIFNRIKNSLISKADRTADHLSVLSLLATLPATLSVALSRRDRLQWKRRPVAVISSSFNRFLLSFALLLAVSVPVFGAQCVVSVDRQIEFRDGERLKMVDRVAHFVAVIGERDLYNSAGKRLTDFKMIIRQDRANFHKSGKADKFDTIEDQQEQYFTTSKNRQLLTNARYYDYCSMKEKGIADKRKNIVAGRVAGAVWVVIFRHPDGELAVFMTIAG